MTAENSELRWHDLATESPPLGRTIILFPVIIDVGHRIDLHRYTTSNPEYARLHGLEQGYTHWFPMPPHPDEDVVEKRVEDAYAAERREQEHFHKGFERAAENIVEALEKLAPDRPALAQSIKARFLKS